jgi:hypothetical protein
VKAASLVKNLQHLEMIADWRPELVEGVVKATMNIRSLTLFGLNQRVSLKDFALLLARL